MGKIIFETARLIVRQYDAERDADNFFLLNSDRDVMRFIRKPKNREECDQFLREIIDGYIEDPLAGRWAVDDKSTGRFIGSFAFIPVEGTEDKQLGYALMKNEWGKGYATELMKKGNRHVFTKTELDKVYGITEVANTASQKVLLKTGFTLFLNYTEKGKQLRKFILKRSTYEKNLGGQNPT